jgi:K+-sensing histidine kinase KdpD
MFSRISDRIPHWLSALIGIALCAVTACLFVMFFEKSSLKAVVPLVFLLVILLTAIKFGSSAGILGTLSAALIFALLLFEPFLRLGIHNSAQRSNLIWMVVGGVALSELLGGPPLSGPSTKSDEAKFRDFDHRARM